MEASESNSYNPENTGGETGQCPYRVREHVDCKDTSNKYLNGEILGIKQGEVFVHYSGWADKWNEWIDWKSDRIIKQWVPGNEFKVNNRLDVKDTVGNWLEAHVIALNEDGTIRIHYKGYTARWEENLAKDSDRIAQIGLHSSAYGSGRKARAGVMAADGDSDSENSNANTEAKKKRLAKEEEFKRSLAEVGFQIHSCGADGNCLFRSVSHQVYGDEEHFKFIRKKCMDYLEHEKEYFKAFLPDGFPNIEAYIENRRKNGVWGDNIEVQVLAEIYGVKLEIYAYDNKPMFVTGNQSQSERVMRLSYHQNSHYNSIIPLGSELKDRILSDSVGNLEEMALASLKLRDQEDGEGVEDSESMMEQMERLRNDGVLISRIRNAVIESRKGAQDVLQRDFDNAIQESLNIVEKDEEEKAIEASKESFEIQQQEDLFVKQAIEASLQDGGAPAQETDASRDDQAIQAAMLASMLENTSLTDPNESEFDQNPIVLHAVELGFNRNLAIQAVRTIGNNEQQVVEYLLNLGVQN